MEIAWRVISRRGRERMGEKVQGIRSINGRYKIDRGEVKNSIGNGEAKEFICMTHGHELRVGKERMLREAGHRMERNKGEKKMGKL